MLCEAFGPGYDDGYTPTRSYRTTRQHIPDIKADPVVPDIEDDDDTEVTSDNGDVTLGSQRDYEGTDDILRLFNEIESEYDSN
jgi:hypothetical protein